MYTFFKLVHVIAAIVWLGAGVAFTVMNVRLSRAGDQQATAVVGEQGEALAKVLFMPASIVTLLAGIAMVLTSEGSIGFGDLWITIGFAGIIASAILGSVLIARATTELKEAAERGDTGMVATLQQRIGTLGAVDLTILFLVVWAMVYKPGA